jgi:hypothetical protein
MHRSLFLSGLVAVISFSAIDPSGIAGEISDMNSYLAQATCSGGLTPNNCAYAKQTKTSLSG